MTKPPRTRPAAERRESLLDAAEALFAARGVATTTVEQITAAAGVAKGSFYLHFGAKEDVVEGLRQRFVDTVLTAVSAAAAREGDWSTTLIAWARACVAAYASGARLHAIVFGEAAPPSSAGLTDNPLIDHLARLLAAGAAAGAWDVPAPRFTALFLFNALHGIALAAEERGAALERQLASHCLRVVGAARPD